MTPSPTKPDWLLSSMERCDKATPKPWTARKESQHKGRVIVEEDGRWVETVAEVYCGAMEGHGATNAAFIAHARSDLPRALTAIQAADALVALIDRCDEDNCLQCEGIRAYLAARHGEPQEKP